MKHLELEPRQLRIPGTKKSLTRLAWSRDGSYLAAPSLDGSVTIWNTHSYELVKTLELGGQFSISTAVWVDTDTSRRLAIAVGNDVGLWTEDGGWKKYDVFQFRETVHDVEWTARAELFVAAGNYIRSCEPGGSISSLTGGTPLGKLLSVTADGQYMATAGNSAELRVYGRVGNDRNWKAIPTEGPVGTKVKDVVWFQKEQTTILATPCRDGVLRLYEVQCGASNRHCVLHQTIGEPNTPIVRTAAFSSKGEWLVTQSSDGMIKVFRHNGDRFALEDYFAISAHDAGKPYRITFSPTDDCLAWVAADGGVALSVLRPFQRHAT